MLEPTAFDLAPDGRLSSPMRRTGASGCRSSTSPATGLTGFTLPGRARRRASASAASRSAASARWRFSADGVALNQPETGALITEYGLAGTPLRSIGALRTTGHEADRQLHLAMNTGIPLPHPAGGYYSSSLPGRRFSAATMPAARWCSSGSCRAASSIRCDAGAEEVAAARPSTAPKSRWSCPTFRSGGRRIRRRQPLGGVCDAGHLRIRRPTARKSAPCSSVAAGLVPPHEPLLRRGRRLLVTPGCYEFSGPINRGAPPAR